MSKPVFKTDPNSLALARFMIAEVRKSKKVPAHTLKFLSSIDAMVNLKSKVSEKQMESLKTLYERYT